MADVIRYYSTLGKTSRGGGGGFITQLSSSRKDVGFATSNNVRQEEIGPRLPKWSDLRDSISIRHKVLLIR